MREKEIAKAREAAPGWRKLGRSLPRGLKGVLRREAELWFPDRETRAYGPWIAERVKYRALAYADPVESGLFSILTAVWNGSPLSYLKRLAQAVVEQNHDGATEWVILDNGISNRALKSFLAELGELPWVELIESWTNCGITCGLRRCLENASGRYVLPVDADDLLYPDALRVASWWVRQHGYPALLYTDEDKIIGQRRYQPYMKPDWDPVLLLNSAYIAHLGVIDRRLARQLGAYTDKRTEGSPDWDVFVRFLIAGHRATHIPEVIYSWRVHASSTADDAETKPYVYASQQAVLRRFLESRPDGTKLKVEQSPLPGGGARIRLAGEHAAALKESDEAWRITRIVIGGAIDPSSSARAMLPLVNSAAARDGFVELIAEDVAIDEPEWRQEALSLFELHSDVAMIGGPIRNRDGAILEAGRYFGFADVCGCPDSGRAFSDPGYFGQMWKQHSVSAVASQFAVLRARFLADVLNGLEESASLAFLGAWAGAVAMRTGMRVVYTPFLSAVADSDWDALVNDSERALFERTNRDLIPDQRFYSRNFSLEKPFGLGSAEVAVASANVGSGWGG